MARDVIARLRVEHQQWDEGMRKAQKGVDDLQKSTGGMDAMMGKAMKSVGAMAAALATVEAAGKAFNKTIGGSQTLTDAWGRTMQAATRVTDSFFEHLAQGDMSNFLNNLDTAISKARELYDAVDNVGTFDIFAQGQRATYKADIKDAKYYIKAGIGDAEHWKDVIRDREAKLEKLMQQEQGVVDNAVTKSFQSITNSNAGMAMFKDLAFSENVSPEKRQERALQLYDKMLKEHSTLIEEQKATFAGDVYVSTMQRTRKWDSAENEELANIFKRFGEKGDETLKAMMALWNRRENARESLAGMRLENLETLNFKGAGGGGTGGYTAQKFDVSDISKSGLGLTSSMAELEGQLAQWQQALKEATTSAGMQAAEAMIVELQRLIDAQPIALRLDVPEESIAEVVAQMQDLGDRIRSDVKPLDTSTLFMGNDGNPLEKTGKDVEKITENIGKTSQAFGMMGNAMQMLEDPSAKVAGIVMGAIANVASSFATALASEKNIWTWMAAAISGAATMTATIASIKSATAGSYADGGVVRGGAFTGDAVPIMANAGEVVLNAAQQQNVAGQLQPRDMGSDRQAYVSGEMIWLGMSNYAKRSGKGEIVTSR